MEHNDNAAPEADKTHNEILTTAVPPGAQVEGTTNSEVSYSQEFPSLTERSVQLLRQTNTPEQRIGELALRAAEKPKEKVEKPDLAERIAANSTLLLEQANHKPLFSSRTVGEALIRAGQYPVTRRYNGFGDRMGTRGLKLPSVVIDGTRHYDLTQVGSSEEAKAAQQKELDAMPLVVLRELTAKLPEAPKQD